MTRRSTFLLCTAWLLLALSASCGPSSPNNSRAADKKPANPAPANPKQEKKAETVASLLETLNLPEECRPKNPMDKIRFRRANDWLKENVTPRRVVLHCPRARLLGHGLDERDNPALKGYYAQVWMTGSGKPYGLKIMHETVKFIADEQTALLIQDAFNSDGKSSVDFTIQGELASVELIQNIITDEGMYLEIKLGNVTVTSSQK